MYLNIKALLFAGIGLFYSSCLPEGRPPKELITSDTKIEDSSNDVVYRQPYDSSSQDKIQFPSEVNPFQDVSNANTDTNVMDTSDSIPSLDSVVETILIDVAHTDTLQDSNDAKVKQDTILVDSLKDTYTEKTDTNTNLLDLIDSFINLDSNKSDTLVDIVLTEISIDSSDVKAKQDTTNSLCYVNNFNEESDLDSLVSQNGIWLWNPEGYLQQTEYGGGWRMAYLDIGKYSDFEVKLKVRMKLIQYGDDHTALVFRYTDNGDTDYNEYEDYGYNLEIEHGNGSQFDLTLENHNNKRLITVNVNGEYDKWYELGIKAVGNQLTAYFEGEEIFIIFDDNYLEGKVGFGSHATNSDFDDLKICPLD